MAGSLPLHVAWKHFFSLLSPPCPPFVLVFFGCFRDRISLCSSGRPEIHCVAKSGPELKGISFRPPSPESWDGKVYVLDLDFEDVCCSVTS